MFEQFERWLRERDRSELTVRGYGEDLRQFGDWYARANDEALSAAGCTPIDIQSYRRAMVEAGVAAATINRRLAAIRAWARWLVASGQRADELAGGVRVIRRADGETAPKALDKNQVHRLLRAAQQGRHAVRDLALLHMMLQVGLRVGEVTALRMDDLVLNCRSGSVLVRCGKGGKQRRVPLNETARKALRAWLDLRAKMGVQHAALWISQKDQPMAKVSIQQVVQGLMETAGLGGFSAHSLRHTFATFYLNDTRDLRGLADVLGHASIKTTAIYTRPTEAQLQARMESLSLNAY